MYRPRFAIGQFNGPWDRDLSDKAMSRLLETLVGINEDFLSVYPECPLLYESGIYYDRVIEDCQEDDDWQDIPTCLTLGYGDCEDLVAYRVAELRVRWGIQAWCDFIRQEDLRGNWLYHIFVRFPNGATEDPSDLLDHKGRLRRVA